MFYGLWYLPFPEDISTEGHRIDDLIRYIDNVIVEAVK